MPPKSESARLPLLRPKRARTPYTRRVDDTAAFHLLHQAFEAQCDVRPQAIAVLDGPREVSYEALDAEANRIAHFLIHQGTLPGDRVGLLLPRSVEAYAAILGILKAGAAYVPIDVEYPAERVGYILHDSGARVVVASARTAKLATPYTGTVLRVDADAGWLHEMPATRPGLQARAREGSALCYIIYTSGSTGRPKGVMIEHRSACHLVRSEQALFRITPSDRVYQAFSLAFDASVEEMWLALAGGAMLVTATNELVQAGAALPQQLAERGVTVLSCVPTLLSLFTDDIATLRLLILGGEVCPDSLVDRWARPGRRIINTYGPTEATVIATCGDLHAGMPVTIGQAIPGYRVHLLNEGLRPVPAGETGEICIGGIGVARGYVGLEQATAERFVADPFECRERTPGRLYRTGDLGRCDADGNIVFLGRLDGQVKIRGFRVELAEIESALMSHEQVLAAACAVQQTGNGLPQLVAFVVARDRRVEPGVLRAHLGRRLPSYMVPFQFQHVDELPVLPSGKLDRGALPVSQAEPALRRPPRELPHGPVARRVLEVWERLFAPTPVGMDDDFFRDLGGHSLLAARMVSELRTDERFASVALRDVYAHPTVATLAAAISAETRPTRTIGAAQPRDERTERIRHATAGTVQAAALLPVMGLRGLPWVAPWVAMFLLLERGASASTAMAGAAAVAVASFPLLLVVTLLAKWMLLGRVTAGRHRLWGAYYLRWWIVQTLVDGLHLDYLGGTPLLPMVYRLFGARIGRDVHMTTDHLAAFDVVHIGDNTCVDDHASILGSTVEDGHLVIGSVHIGRRCLVGVRAVVAPNTRMEHDARLTDLSLLSSGASIPRGETWTGSPARAGATPAPMADAAPARGAAQRAASLVLYALAVLLLPLTILAGFLPGILLLLATDPLTQPFQYLLSLPWVGACFVLVVAAEVAVLKWIVLGRARAGRYPLHGSVYVRYWLVDRLLMLSLDVVAPLRATLYLAPWFRALGARLGRFVELSTATSTVPDLIQIDDGGTVADEATLGAPHIEHGWMTLAPTRLGARAFVGNSAVVPGGATLGDRTLVGVLSLPPAEPADAARADAAWLGSPPIALPRRQRSARFDEARTYRPPPHLVATRAIIELARITLPPAGHVFVSSTVVVPMLALWERIGALGALALFPAVYVAACAVVGLAAAATKWVVVGRYRPFEHPLWSLFVWRLEFVNALYEFLVTPLLLEPLQGTPFLPWYQRLLGAQIGRRVYADTTGFLEWDLVHVGDRAAINEDAILQTHLFEDRVLKGSTLRIGDDCVVGAGAVVLYDTNMQDGARLEALSLLMKGESLPAGTVWTGIPAS